MQFTNHTAQRLHYEAQAELTRFADAPSNPADLNALVHLAVAYAIEQGCVLATDGREVEVKREPLPAGWHRVGVVHREAA